MSGDERSSERMTAKEAVRQVRHEIRRIRQARTLLEQVQAAIAAPLPQELTAMARGERPLSAEAHLLGALQAAAAQLENIENDLRLAVDAKTLSRLEKDWQRGDLPNEIDLRLIRSALNEQKA